MGRSVSYATGSQVVTYSYMEDEKCDECGGTGAMDGEDCEYCEDGFLVDNDGWRFEQLVEDFRSHLKELFPSVEPADEWIGREDHVLAKNKLAKFGMSEYCGLVSYWIVRNDDWPYDSDVSEAFSKRWIASIEDKFVKAFGELTKIGSFSNGEGVYRHISNS